MTDPELVRAIQSGDGTALETLYQRYLSVVWRYAYARLRRDVHAAEDATSETFLAAVRGIRDKDADGGPVGAWLIGIARHKVSDHWRRAGRMTAGDVEGHATREDDGPATTAEAAEQREMVAQVLDRMPDDERIVLEWKYLDDLSVSEIAPRLGRTEKAVEALLYRARRSFRELSGKQFLSGT